MKKNWQEICIVKKIAVENFFRTKVKLPSLINCDELRYLHSASPVGWGICRTIFVHRWFIEGNFCWKNFGFCAILIDAHFEFKGSQIRRFYGSSLFWMWPKKMRPVEFWKAQKKIEGPSFFLCRFVFGNWEQTKRVLLQRWQHHGFWFFINLFLLLKYSLVWDHIDRTEISKIPPHFACFSRLPSFSWHLPGIHWRTF